MALKTIASLLTDRAADASSLNAARTLAEREQAHLDVYCLGIDPTRYETLPSGSAIVVDQGRELAQATANDLARWVTDITQGDGPTTSVESTVTAQLMLERHVARLARYTDLVVSTQPYGPETSPLSAMVLEAVLFGAQASALVVPHGMDALPDFKSITVAWNESEEALSAIKRALPLIKAADKVDIVMVDPPSRSPERSDPGGALSLWLARHGARCEVSVLSKTLPRVGDVLMRFVNDNASDLMVMGAYGHSRFREALIGGPTRDLLEETTCPILMAR